MKNNPPSEINEPSKLATHKLKIFNLSSQGGEKTQ